MKLQIYSSMTHVNGPEPYRTNVSCSHSVRYSLQARAMEYTCSCCQEITTTEKQVEMTCPDGSTFTYTYLNIEQCGCVQNECPAKAVGSSSILKKP